MGIIRNYFGYLEACRRLAELAPASSHQCQAPVVGRPYRILIFAFDAIGDFILSTPAFRLLRESFPDSRIEVVCSSRNYELAVAYGIFDFVHRYELNGNRGWELPPELERGGFDYVFNLFDEPDEFALVKMLGFLDGKNSLISIPIRFKSKWQQLILKKQNVFQAATVEDARPFAERILAIATALGQKVPREYRYEFPKQEPKEILKAPGNLKLLWVPAGSQKANQLTPVLIENIAAELKKYPFIKCYAFENALPPEVQKALPDVVILKTKTIMDAGAFLGQMDMVLTTDTAAAHLATCYDVPVLVMRVNSPSKPAFDPVYGPNKVVVSRNGKLSGIDFNLLNEAITKMITTINAEKN